MACSRPSLVPCAFVKCDNITDSSTGFCISHQSSVALEVAESPTPSNPKPKEQTICITNHFRGSDKDCIDLVVSKVEAYLKKTKPNECCERTQPTEREPTRTYNRVYVDLDGNLPCKDAKEFLEKVEAIREVLKTELLGSHSVMESCMYQCPDDNSTFTNKLSWRVTYTHLHGNKDAIEQWVRNKFYKQLKPLLLTTIPVRLLEAGAKLKKDFKREDGSLEIDMSVYSRKGRKMRMMYQSKPNQKRPNKLVSGDFIDTLITYIPPDSVLLSKKEVVDERLPVNAIIHHMEAINPTEGSVATETTSSDPYHEPTEDEEEAKSLLMEVVSYLNQHRFDYYPLWLRLGFVLYNENFTVDEFIELSKRSKHYKEATSPKWIKSKWNNFRKSRLNQSTLWRWLSEDDPEQYQELSARRKDFWQLMTCMSHAEVAQFFYNMKTDSYVYHEMCGWYQLGDNNKWDLYEKTPSMLKSDIWNTLKRIAKEHLQAIPIPEKPEEPSDSYTLEEKQYKAKIKAIWKFVNAIGTSGFVDGVIAFLPSMYKDEELCNKMDEQRHLFAFSDKVIDLNTMEPRDIEPTDYISINTGYPFPTKRNPEARSEVIDCLRSIFESNEDIEKFPDSLGEMTRYALEHIATCLCGNNKYERFYIWTGKGGNGKGVLSEIVKRVLGQYYHPIPHTIITKTTDKKDSACPPLAKAKGRRFIQFSEPESEDKFQVGAIKELTGGDEITARDLYKTTIIYKPQWSLYGQTNNIPKLNRADGGAGRRIRVIPFIYSFVSDPTEPHHKAINVELKDKIVKNEGWRDEFIWLLIEAYTRVKQGGLSEPSSVLEASKEYMEDNNPVGAWLRNTYTIGLDPNDNRYWVSASDMLEKYKTDMNHPISAERFKGGMILCDVEQKKVSHDFKIRIGDGTFEETKKAGRYWVGVRLIE